MSTYLVYYEPRQQPNATLAPDGLRLLRGRCQFDGNSRDVVVYAKHCGPSGKRITFEAVFSEDTTPPTLVAHAGAIAWMTKLGTALPEFYISNGHIIRSKDGAIVVQGDEWNPQS